MPRPLIADELLTAEQKKRRERNLRYRQKMNETSSQTKTKKKSSSQKRVKSKPRKRNIKLPKTQFELLAQTGTEGGDISNRSQTQFGTLIQFPSQTFQEGFETNSTPSSQTRRENNYEKKIQNLEEEINFLKMALEEKYDLKQKITWGDLINKWSNTLIEKLTPDSFSIQISRLISRIQKIIVMMIAAALAISCGWFSVKLSAPFFGVGEDGIFSAIAAEGLAALFAIFGAISNKSWQRWGSRLFGLAIVSIITSFCYLGIGDQLNKESFSYQVSSKELSESTQAIERLKAQLSALPPNRVSKRQDLENQITKERDHFSGISNKIQSIKTQNPSSIKQAGPFVIRVGLCLGMMILCEMLIGLVFKKKGTFA